MNFSRNVLQTWVMTPPEFATAHDFGSVEINREKFFWKIDYYDSKFEFGGDPYEGLVARILTIMRADEY